MIDINKQFENKKLSIAKLLAFGFEKRGNEYFYSTNLAEGQFEMRVTLDETGTLQTDVVDTDLQESYLLHRVSGATGTFIGSVRSEYEDVLNEISNHCFEPDVFQTTQAKQVIDYAREKYHDELEFLWPKFSDNAVLRRKDNAKWYAVLLVLSRRKLGFDSDEIVDILDIRINPEEIEMVVDGRNYFPGYHMNKKHWVTICLDGSVSMGEIFKRIDESYAIATKK